MGLSGLTLDAELAKRWRLVLEQNGLNVRVDEVEQKKQLEFEQQHGGGSTSKWIAVPVRIQNEAAELHVIESHLRDCPDDDVRIGFMPPKTKADRQLLSRVQEILAAAGAVVGTKKEIKK